MNKSCLIQVYSYKMINIAKKFFLITIIPIFIFFLISCMETPTDKSPGLFESAESGDVLILSEGLMGYDNSSISLIKSKSGTVIREYFKSANNNEYLGDTANDILLKGDTAYIVLTTPSIIRKFNINTGKKKGDIILPENCQPRRITQISNTLLCVTCLLRSSVYIFSDIDTSISYEIMTGPQPEGVSYFNGLIFTANSAYGDFNYLHPDAETVSVISSENFQETKKIKSGVNCTEVLVNPIKNTLYAVYYHLPSMQDSIGGIIEYDLGTLTPKRNWKIRARNLNLSSSGDSLIFISRMHKGSTKNEEASVSAIDLNNSQIYKLISNPNNKDIWYGLSISPFDESIWICNARNHINNGEIVVYRRNDLTNPAMRFDVMLNPNSVKFIK